MLTVANEHSGKLPRSIIKSITTFLGQAIRCTSNINANQVALHRFFFTREFIRIPRFRCYDPAINMAGEECIVSFITEEERQLICRLMRAMVKEGEEMQPHFYDQVDLFFGKTKNPELFPTEFLLQFLSGKRAASIIEGYAKQPCDSFKPSRQALARVLSRIGGSPYFVPEPSAFNIPPPHAFDFQPTTWRILPSPHNMPDKVIRQDRPDKAHPYRTLQHTTIQTPPSSSLDSNDEEGSKQDYFLARDVYFAFVNGTLFQATIRGPREKKRGSEA